MDRTDRPHTPDPVGPDPVKSADPIADWPAHRLVWAEELQGMGLSRVALFDATGERLQHVLAACLQTGQVIRLAVDANGRWERAGDQLAKVQEFRPAPLRVTLASPD